MLRGKSQRITLAVIASLMLASGAVDAGPAHAAVTDVRLTRPLYVDPYTPAATAATRDSRFAGLAQQPVGRWLTEQLTVANPDPARDVRSVTRSYLGSARQAGRTAVLVPYAIPMRDCSAWSAGGFPTHDAYKRWIDEIAKGIRDVSGSSPMVVLEPDALPMLGVCDGQGDRTGSLAYAVRALSAAGAWVYLDAGNSVWQPASVMAARLRAAGVKDARGFATNVSGFRPTSEERRFGSAVLADLKAKGIKNRRFVVNTSRNGGTVPADEWCNPSAARLGEAPRVVNDAEVDAYLWVKPPGESDGDCGRGEPAPGVWWDEGALRLLQ